MPNAAAGLAEQMTGGPGWMNILFLAVIPAFSEEFVFQRRLFPWIQKPWLLEGSTYERIDFWINASKF